MKTALLITCEHGGNQVPAAYQALFNALHSVLQTHRGYDLGALLMADEISDAFDAPLVASTVTRLLVDLNRSIGHPRLHTETVRRAAPEIRQQIIADHYQPYRTEVESLVSQKIASGLRVVHISSHSFTPKLDGVVRTADIGLLYDPARPGEVELSRRWKAALRQTDPALRVRRNYPYVGKDDGFMPYLRSRYTPAAYIGVELEINQAIVIGPARRWLALRATLIAALRMALTKPLD